MPQDTTVSTDRLQKSSECELDLHAGKGDTISCPIHPFKRHRPFKFRPFQYSYFDQWARWLLSDHPRHRGDFQSQAHQLLSDVIICKENEIHREG